MLKFPQPGKETVKRHCEKQLPKIRSKIRLHTPDDAAKVPYYADLLQLLHETAYSILSGTPTQLEAVVQEIERHFPDFSTYCKKSPTTRQKNYEKNAAKLQLHIRTAFDYDGFSNDTKEGAYWLVKTYGKRICPYCQLHHINYYFSDAKKWSMRPPLDHFYPRSKYPYLGLSICNLIPSCWQCNSSVKSDNDPRNLGVPHPLQGHVPIDIQFKIIHKDALLRVRTEDDIQIAVTGQTDAKAHIDFFKLNDRYQWYTAELLDLYNKNRKYSDIDKDFHKLITQTEFTLGFPIDKAPERALGLCLAAVAEKLAPVKRANSS